MCGIAGIVSLAPGLAPPSREALERMAGALRHRGPDEAGIYRDARAGLAHARLSIIDLAHGRQPLCNEDQTLWITFNGELFNYVELRAELAAAGHVFRTRGDTEVVVHAWEEWKLDAFRRFNGQWALALWDARDRALILSRDPLGILPLYVREEPGRVRFASEVKALFSDRDVPRALDPLGLAQVFTFWSTLAPRTVFRDVAELRPGHTRVYRGGRVVETSHAGRRFTPRFAGSIEEATSEVRRLLEHAAALRLTRSDVPVGSYLSGGLDSSLVAALGREHAGRRFATFSVRFEDEEYDETRFQRLVAERLRTDHRELVVRRRDIAEAFPDVVRHAERPFLRTAPAPLFLLSKLVRESGTKVVLTGEGADEMFAGYDLFREARVRRFWARDPGSRTRPRLLERLYPWLARSPVARSAMARRFFGRNLERAGEPGFGHEPRWSVTAALQRLFSPALRETLRGSDPVADFLGGLDLRGLSPLAGDQVVEARTLLSGYLLSVQGDRMLMAHGVEGRFPFLDPELIAFADALPDGHKLSGLDEKHVLKRVGLGVIPDEILRRTKQPYRAPDAAAFAGDDAPDWVDACLSPEAVEAAGVFLPEGVAALRRKLRDRGGDAPFSNADNMATVGVLSTQLLHRQFLAGAPPAPPPAPLTVRVDRLEEARSGSERKEA
ncbi:MAG TPA: asparagine synthase (glutamine-hydrolyzing) [Planctomycetota bacterium]